MVSLPVTEPSRRRNRSVPDFSSTATITDAIPEISVVVPVFGCAECLPVLHRRLVETLRGMSVTFEIIFADDRSTDGSWPVVCDLVRANGHVRACRLAHNCGQPSAIAAGLSLARGRWSVVMDCDLQHPPEHVPVMYSRTGSGADCILSIMEAREDELHRLVASKTFFWLFRLLGGHPLSGRCDTFSMLSGRARQAYLGLDRIHRGYITNVLRMDLPTVTVRYHKSGRPAGSSAYTMKQLLWRALHAMTLLEERVQTVLVTLAMISLAVALAGWFVDDPLPRTSLIVTGGTVFIAVCASWLGFRRWLRRTAEPTWRIAELREPKSASPHRFGADEPRSDRNLST